MSRHYSGNQYNVAYDPKKLGNWEVAKFYCDKPFTRTGYSNFIANEKGYIIPGYPRAPKSVPTPCVSWDLPKKITREVANQLNGLAYLKDKQRTCRQPKRPSFLFAKDELNDEESVSSRRVDESPELSEDDAAKDFDEEEDEDYSICPIHHVKVWKNRQIQRKPSTNDGRFCICE
ncbi:unnamed protein product [Brassicogethes aeneus]|uniref:Cilia- and flagella-associated protein 126 n=1 Tax=Brassicogethes aeneus TaxID=1431903 RepID=A0A9P0FD69_BRAAE|nr:unnamed protein product [Brassicogethes aeneus]